tara:strand:- start:3490 stop:3849 length:360 start_codon:yes stop_codon:yes gene_type:complete
MVLCKMTISKNGKFQCPKCHKNLIWNFATTRRPAKHGYNAICDQCEKYEALVDYMDNIADTDLLFHEHIFFQMCCADGDKSGDQRFEEFLEYRKKIGKHDPTLENIHKLIFAKMRIDIK